MADFVVTNNPTPIPTPKPTVVAPNPEMSVTPNDNKPKKIILILVAVVVAVVIIAGAGLGVAAAIAYGKISINNPALEKQVTQTVLGLPFMPKTPEYLLTAALTAQSKVSKHSVNLSMAVDTGSPIPDLGISSIDVSLTGAVDYSNPKNTRLTLNGSVTKDFNVDLRKDTSILYFKINKVPLMIATLYGIKDTDKLNQVLTNWVAWDTSSLNTPARTTLEQNQPQTTSYTNEAVQKVINTLEDQKVAKAIVVSDDKVDSFATYKLDLKPTPDLIDQISNDIASPSAVAPGVTSNYTPPKTSDYVKDMEVAMWIDKSSYYVRKLSVSLKMVTPSANSLGALGGVPITGLGNSTQVSIASVLILSDFGKDVAVETPSQSITPDKYVQQIMALTNIQQNITETASRSADARKQQALIVITDALEKYHTDHNNYPAALNALVPTYLPQLPIDPYTNQPYWYGTTNGARGYKLQTRMTNGSYYVVTYPQQ